LATALVVKSANQRNIFKRIVKYKAFYLMFLPVFAYYVIFHYIPLYGLRLAFYNYGIFGNTDFIGWENFQTIFSSRPFFEAFRNTLIISGSNLILGLIFPIIFALLLNEIRTGPFKKFTQTVVYLPHFLSWVVVASLFSLFLSPDGGVANEVIKLFGGKPQYFMISERWWRPIFLSVIRWKETGWGAIIYLAALSGINPDLYEAAAMDGAGKLKQTWHITLPSLLTTILTVFILNLSKILDIFQQVFVMYNAQVYSVSDVIDTYTYRLAFVYNDIDLAIAVGLFKSVIAMTLVLITNNISKRIKGESIL
jgi:putative aldouronate transport system permease protein